MAETHAGTVIDGKYEVIASIGSGGMSEVWLARDRRLGKLWAIKEIKPNVSGARGEANRQALIDEANFMKRLDHPAIPRVVDIIDTGRTVFVVMDFVDGRPLSEVLRQHGRGFAQEEVADWGIQLCDVLGYLHGLDPPVVYRDMKPNNVMLRDDGSVKLIDFGIAVELGTGETKQDRLVGTVGYSAPEQVDSRMLATHETDARSDIYALGTTLYALVTGHVPRKVRQDDGSSRVDFDLQPIRNVDPTLSDGLERVIVRATQREPDARYQKIGEMRYDLAHYEDLSEEHRAAQQAKVDKVVRRLRAAGVAACLGLVCLVASVMLRGASYDSLVHAAGVASYAEENVVVEGSGNGQVRTADPSEAELTYLRAIDLEPARIETYELLLDAYKADNVFSPTESDRWLDVWQEHGRSIADDPLIGRLCYDAGILYLCYYDYTGVRDLGTVDGEGTLPSASVGQGAVQSAMRSVVWFERALAACDEQRGYYAGLEVPAEIEDDASPGAKLNEYAALKSYLTIGAFYETVSQASMEGRDTTEVYADLWHAFEEALVGPSELMADETEPIVQLRLCQVAFESVRSPAYLAGFRRAGVTQEQAEGLLASIEERTRALGDFCEANREAAGAIYDEIVDGSGEALAAIRATYAGPTARVRPQEEGV